MPSAFAQKSIQAGSQRSLCACVVNPLKLAYTRRSIIVTVYLHDVHSCLSECRRVGAPQQVLSNSPGTWAVHRPQQEDSSRSSTNAKHTSTNQSTHKEPSLRSECSCEEFCAASILHLSDARIRPDSAVKHAA